MATRKPILSTVDIAKALGKSGYQAERTRLQKAETLARLATEASAKNILLNPGDVGGEYDFARALTTTMGGKGPRGITLDDLKRFESFTNKLEKKYVKKGITAKHVIQFSNDIDRERSNNQIHIAPLVRAQNGMLLFVTNAGPESDFVRHQVRVRFPDFHAFVAKPGKAVDIPKFAKDMLAGRLEFDCSCPRHRYVFRYIATKGGFNISQQFGGRSENAFPKLTNPKLEGIACKHALRVMKQIVLGTGIAPAIATALKAARDKEGAAVTFSASEATAAAEKQKATAHHARHKIETDKQAVERRSKTTIGRARALQAAASEAMRRAASEAASSRKQLEKAFQKVETSKAPMTKAMRDQMIARLMTMKTTD